MSSWNSPNAGWYLSGLSMLLVRVGNSCSLSIHPRDGPSSDPASSCATPCATIVRTAASSESMRAAEKAWRRMMNLAAAGIREHLRAETGQVGAARDQQAGVAGLEQGVDGKGAVRGVAGMGRVITLRGGSGRCRPR